MPNAQRRSSGNVVSSSSLGGNVSTPPAPERGTGNSAQPSGNDPALLAGLTIATGTVLPSFPTVAGRGRAADPIDPTLAAAFAAQLAGTEPGRMHVGSLNDLNREVKKHANKWIKANGGKDSVTVDYVTMKDATEALPKAQKDKGHKVTAWRARRIVAAAAA